MRLSRPRLSFGDSDLDVEHLRLEFERRQWIRLPQLLNADLLAWVQAEIERAEFEEFDHARSGPVQARELCMIENAAWNLLHFLANDPRLFELVEQVTHCGHIGCFTGRVYRMLPGPAHYDSWHSDILDHRIVAMTVNLSAAAYDGGVLQFRRSESTEIISEIANTGSGDAILFRLADDLTHRVSAVEGTMPKTAFAGWFKSEPEFLSLLTPVVRRK